MRPAAKGDEVGGRAMELRGDEIHKALELPGRCDSWWTESVTRVALLFGSPSSHLTSKADSSGSVWVVRGHQCTSTPSVS